MKNMKVSQKLILGFGIIALLCAAIGGVGIAGLTQIIDADTMLYKNQTEPLPDIAKVLEYSQRLRIELRNAIIYSNDPTHLASIETSMKNTEKEFEQYLANYDVTITDDAARKAFDDGVNLYETSYKPAMHNIFEASKGDTPLEALIQQMEQAGDATSKMVENFTSCLTIKVESGEAMNAQNDQLYQTLLILIIVSVGVALTFAVMLALYISGMISKPLGVISGLLLRFATEGDLSITAEESQAYETRSKDETGACLASLKSVIDRLRDVSDTLEKVSAGDLTADIRLLSPKDTIGMSIARMSESLNSMFGEIRTASDQVSSGAGQVSQAAQGLASGSSEQAASVQEFTATLSELQEKTMHNAESTAKAREINNLAGVRLEESIRSMDEMLSAMKAIDESSGSIAKVIRVIEDIARQTNILALNAAVEAARAGQYGKSFAVVADEVRDLASKSATAAKETAALIEGSSERVREGNTIVAKTSADLEAAVENARESTRLIEMVATASTDQANSINGINKGIEQISVVVQANSATAQQSAAASQEMAAQAVVLNEIISKFRLKKGEGNRLTPPSTAKAPYNTKERPDSNEYGMGKY